MADNRLLSQFIKNELEAYIQDQRLTDSPLMVKLIIRAFEAYDEYRFLTSFHKTPGGAYSEQPFNEANLLET